MKGKKIEAYKSDIFWWQASVTQVELLLRRTTFYRSVLWAANNSAL
jgi:hypothetical protein